MDYGLPQDVQRFREEVRSFIAEHKTPALLDEIADAHRMGYGPESKNFMRATAEAGFTGIAWPKEYGGQGKGALYLWALAEELSYEDMPFDTLTFNSIGPTIMHFGSEEQKREWLPKIQSGEMSFALGYTEPNAGTDLASLQTRATRDGDEWVINGQKIYTSHAHLATHVFMAARTDPSAPKHRGISMFVFPLSAKGITIRPLWTFGPGRTNESFYEDVRIPADSLVGEENRGWYMLSSALDLERVAIATYRPLERALEDLARYIRQDRPELQEDPLTRSEVGQQRMRVEVARALATNNATLVHNDLVPTMEASMAKVWVTDSRERMMNGAMDLLGRAGGLQRESGELAPVGGDFEATWRSSPPGRFGGGTNDIQRRIIASRGLGLPR